MFSIPFGLISALLCVSVASAQSYVCGFRNLQAFSFTTSYLTSPNYPMLYPRSTTCEWVITASAGYVVELTFVTFETDGYFISGSCSTSFSDFLEIYDGSYRTSTKILGKYCSNKLPANVYSSGTSLYLRFVTNSYTEKKGFKIKYKAVKPKPDSSICSPFNTFYQNNNIQVSGSSGSIESPLYGSKYPSNMQCTWVITVPEGEKIMLSYTSYFSVGKAYYCTSSYTNRDYIQIRNGKYSFSGILRTDCGQIKPTSVFYSSGRYVWIRFKSYSNNDNPTNTTGFKIKYKAIAAKDSESSDPSGIGTIVGIVIGVSILIVLVCICVCIAQRKRTPGHVTVQAPTAAQTTTVQLGTQHQPVRYPQQAQGGYVVPPPPAGYTPASQSGYPPQARGYPPPSQGGYQYPMLGNYPNKTTSSSGTPASGYPPQSSVPMMSYPQQPIPDDPPPPYPGLPAEYLPQSASGQPAPGNPNPSYPPVQSAQTQQSSPYPPQSASGQPAPGNANPPYPPVQSAQTQQSSPYPPQSASGQPAPGNANPPYPLPQGVDMQQSSQQATAPLPF